MWIYLRHYINWMILYATLTTFSTVGPYDLNWETQQYKCSLSQAIAFSLLALLQAVNLFWLFLIIRIAKNYVFKSQLADERSDDEETEEDHEGGAVNANGKTLEGGSNSSRTHEGETYADAAAMGTDNEKRGREGKKVV